MVKICPKCGTTVEHNFCPNCGTKVEEAVEATYEVRQDVVIVQQTEGTYENQKPKAKITAASTGVIAYITWVGLILALVIGDREAAKFHVNQALVINLASVLVSIVGAITPIIGGLISFAGTVFCIVCWGMGLYYAWKEQKKEVPLLGQIKLL